MPTSQPIDLGLGFIRRLRRPLEGGFRLSLDIADGYDPASVDHWRFVLQTRGVTSPTVFASETVDISGQIVTLHYLPADASVDDATVTVADVVENRLCEWAVTAYNADDEPVWTVMGDVDFVEHPGASSENGSTAASSVTVALDGSESITLTVLSNSTSEGVTAANLASTIHAATTKGTPVDADAFALVDSAASNGLKKTLWSAVKATLKTYFDPLYQAAGSYLTSLTTSTPTSLTGLIKGNGSVLSAAVAGTDYATAAQGAAADAAKAKTDYLTVTGSVDLDTINTRVSELDAAVVLQGTWDASAGTFPGSGTAQAGASWIVATGGTVDGVVFAIGDRIIATTDNASTSTFSGNWFKADYTDAVSSVAGRTGVVTLSASDVSGLATVATTGAYSDLSGTPTAFDPASPGAIGGTTPAAGTFTNLAVNGGGNALVVTGNIAFDILSRDTDWSVGYGSSATMSMRNSFLFRWSDTGHFLSAFDAGLSKAAAGRLEINSGTAGTLRDLILRDIILNASSSITPANNGELVFEATDNSTITVKYKGSDGTVRSGTIALS